MNKLKTYLSLIVILIIQSSSAQGYLNKRFSFSYQPGYSFSGGYYEFPFMLHHRANVGFAVSDHITINANFLYSTRNDDDHYNYNEYRLKDIGGGLSVLFFKKLHQSYAPLGRYIGLCVDYGQQSGEHPALNPTADESTSYTEIGKTDLIIISAMFGRNFIIKDRIILGYGIQWGYVLGDNQAQRHLGKPFFNLGFIF